MMEEAGNSKGDGATSSPKSLVFDMLQPFTHNDILQSSAGWERTRLLSLPGFKDYIQSSAGWERTRLLSLPSFKDDKEVTAQTLRPR